MSLKIRFSLKSVFVITAIVAFGVYWMPLKTEITCDYLRTGPLVNQPYDVERISIEGRTITNSFTPVIENIELLSVKPSNDPRLGQWSIEFRTNLPNKFSLGRYEILRFRPAGQ